MSKEKSANVTASKMGWIRLQSCSRDHTVVYWAFSDSMEGVPGARDTTQSASTSHYAKSTESSSLSTPLLYGILQATVVTWGVCVHGLQTLANVAES